MRLTEEFVLGTAAGGQHCLNVFIIGQDLDRSFDTAEYRPARPDNILLIQFQPGVTPDLLGCVSRDHLLTIALFTFLGQIVVVGHLPPAWPPACPLDTQQYTSSQPGHQTPTVLL